MALSTLKYSVWEEAEIVHQHFQQAYEVFQRDAYSDGEPVMCELHDAFGTYGTSHHNCLGCNFADSTLLIATFLRQSQTHDTIQYAFSTYMILTYLLVERIDTVFDIIELNKAYRSQHFGVLMEIRRWANFLKHPKAFLLTHHPVFSFSAASKNDELRKIATIVIDRPFLDKYYSSNDKDKALFNELENKENVLVIFPDAVDITNRICRAMHDCVAVIRDNPVYRFALETQTTFYDYWVDTPNA